MVVLYIISVFGENFDCLCFHDSPHAVVITPQFLLVYLQTGLDSLCKILHKTMGRFSVISTSQ